jgi:hypothetical protein
VAGSSRQHKSAKRRKELDRQARQQEKRERRTEKVHGGGGPPIDWGEASPGAPQTAGPAPGTTPDVPEKQGP